jgi:hypothetical protein
MSTDPPAWAIDQLIDPRPRTGIHQQSPPSALRQPAALRLTRGATSWTFPRFRRPSVHESGGRPFQPSRGHSHPRPNYSTSRDRNLRERYGIRLRRRRSPGSQVVISVEAGVSVTSTRQAPYDIFTRTSVRLPFVGPSVSDWLAPALGGTVKPPPDSTSRFDGLSGSRVSRAQGLHIQLGPAVTASVDVGDTKRDSRVWADIEVTARPQAPLILGSRTAGPLRPDTRVGDHQNATTSARSCRVDIRHHRILLLHRN